MAIELFKHNQEAYESAVAMLDAVGKACVIHPTGTGKSFIGFKLCEDNPGKKVLWLSPSEYIFRTQLENIRRDSDDWQPENIIFVTYQKLMRMTDEEIKGLAPDIMIFDEFHRAGAYEWMKNVWKLIFMFPNVPMLGLSATNIRYLDNQRDMAEELFGGNIASTLTLGEAIVKNILNPPKYIMSVYSFQEQLEKYKKRIGHSKTKAVRDDAEKYLEALRRALDKADGIDDVLDKNIEDRTGKYIVFCSSYEHMQEIINDHIRDWVSKIDSDPIIYTFYSADAGSDKSFREFKADNNNDHLRLLFCIDALNEGVHVDDVSGVILLRPTVSPIVYKQQIGRALSASKAKNPIIFDIVNNIENLYSIDTVKEEMQAAIRYFRHSGETDKVVNERFEIIDKAAECRELFDRLDSVLSAGWDKMFDLARNYYEEHGDLLVPEKTMVLDEQGRALCLGNWIKQQRDVYNGISKGVLTEVQIAKLSAIGMRWYKYNKDFYWDRFIDECRKYLLAHGNLLIPLDYETDDNIKIGNFVMRLRIARKNNKPYRYLTDENIAQLDSLGMVWDVTEYMQQKKYDLLKQYRDEHGDINSMPKDYVDEQTGIPLYSWLNGLRYARNHPEAKKKSVITADDVKKLEDLGIIWDIEFQTFYDIAKAYYEENGNLEIARHKKINGKWIGSWLENERKKYHEGKLSQEEIQKLELIGMVWTQSDTDRWEKSFSIAEKYYKEHGDINHISDDYYEGFGLKNWLLEQKRQGEGLSRRTLSDERRRKLESIGLEFGFRLRDDAWDARYKEAEIYVSEHGMIKDALVKNGFCGNPALQRWIRTQIRCYQSGSLRKERKEKLDKLGIDWNTPISKRRSVETKNQVAATQ